MTAAEHEPACDEAPGAVADLRCAAGPSDGSGRHDGSRRYAERLRLLERLSERLTLANVPHAIRRHVVNGAPSPGDGPTIPVLVVADQWVKVLYWSSVPMFVWPDLVRRWPCDEEGVDRLASTIAVAWHSRRDRR